MFCQPPHTKTWWFSSSLRFSSVKGGRQIRRTPWQCRCFSLILSSCHFLAAAFARGIFGGLDSCDTTTEFFYVKFGKTKKPCCTLLYIYWVTFVGNMVFDWLVVWLFIRNYAFLGWQLLDFFWGKYGFLGGSLCDCCVSQKSPPAFPRSSFFILFFLLVVSIAVSLFVDDLVEFDK